MSDFDNDFDDVQSNEDQRPDNWEEECEKMDELKIEDSEEEQENNVPQQTAVKSAVVRNGAPRKHYDMFGDKEEEEDLTTEKPLDDPIAEKRRLQKLIEKGDRAICDDLFSGFQRPDGTTIGAEKKVEKKTTKQLAQSTASTSNDLWESVVFNKQSELEAFAHKMTGPIKKSPIKSAGFYKFTDMIMKDLGAKLESKDMKNLINKLQTMFKQKEAEENMKKQAKTKPSQKYDKDDEYEMMYGDLEEDYDEDEAFYAEYM